LRWRAARVIKNVSGYDMNKLFIGSLGTLGIITEATFKLLPIPATRATLAAVFPSLDQAEAVVVRTLQSFLLPEAVELLDPHALAAVAAVLGLAGAGGHALVVTVGGSHETVERQVRDFGQLLAEAGAERTFTLREADATAASAAARDALSAAVPGTGRVSVKIGVPIGRTAALFAAAERLGQRQRWQAAVSSHAGSGVVRADYATGDSLPDAVRDGLEELRREAEAAGGSLAVEAAPPAVKSSLDAWGKPGDAFSVMRRLKAQFDPGAVLSPGRFVGGI
jgi:glycolate oxidase FAD binding subunit